MKALIIIANHFEDSQLLVPLYWLQEEGTKVDIVWMKKGMLKVMRGYELRPAKLLTKLGWTIIPYRPLTPSHPAPAAPASA